MSEEIRNEEQSESLPNELPIVEATEQNEANPLSGEPEVEGSQGEKKKRRNIKISLKSYVVSTVAIILATLMTTYAFCSGVYKKKYGELISDGDVIVSGDATDKGEGFSEVDIIDFLLERYFYGEIDKSKMSAESLKAYIAATGDIYATYYTQEELEERTDEDAGRMQGIGVTVINSTVTIKNSGIAVLKITNVIKDSPAAEVGVRAGDLIVYVGADKTQSVNSLGYDEALKRLKGPSGTVAEFTVFRKSGESYTEVFFQATRREVIAESVNYRVSTLDPKIGIINILNFDFTTPTQFTDAVEALKASGCEKFVLDVRNNPGGALVSVGAVLSYFLNEGDVYIRTEDKNGKIESRKVGVVSGYTDDYASCNVSKEDIGKYKDLNMVVICNEYTASAGELFTATFRDYELGKIVGNTTYGKGKMQTTYALATFGLEGAIKFTTHMYYSAKSDNYDGIGIKPDEGCAVELSEEAKTYNIYDLPDDKDNQLMEAIKHFK